MARTEWWSGSSVSQFVNVSGRLQPRLASSAAVWSSIDASQLSIGVAAGVAVRNFPTYGLTPAFSRSVDMTAFGSHSIPIE